MQSRGTRCTLRYDGKHYSQHNTRIDRVPALYHYPKTDWCECVLGCAFVWLVAWWRLTLFLLLLSRSLSLSICAALVVVAGDVLHKRTIHRQIGMSSCVKFSYNLLNQFVRIRYIFLCAATPVHVQREVFPCCRMLRYKSFTQTTFGTV